MPEKAHEWDGVADDLFEWMNGEVSYYVEALRGGSRNPFSAEVSEKEKRDYFARQLYQVAPDGSIQYDTPNPEGRDKILKTYGTQAYAEILQTVKPKQGLRSPPEPIESAMEALIPPMPEDEEQVEPV